MIKLPCRSTVAFSRDQSLEHYSFWLMPTTFHFICKKTILHADSAANEKFSVRKLDEGRTWFLSNGFTLNKNKIRETCFITYRWTKTSLFTLLLMLININSALWFYLYNMTIKGNVCVFVRWITAQKSHLDRVPHPQPNKLITLMTQNLN